MDVTFRHKYNIGGSDVTVTVADNLEWEDLVTFRAKAKAHEHLKEESVGTSINTYKEIKDWLVKGT